MDRRHDLFYMVCYLVAVILKLIQAAVITVPPVPVTVPLFTTAKFTCEGNGNTLNWIIQNGKDIQTLDFDIQQQRGIAFTNPGGPGDLSSVLNISGMPHNDGVGIACQVFSFQPFKQVFSNTSILTIRDVSSVENLTINFTSNNSLEITWSPPVYWFPPDSLVTYQVLVIDDEDGDIILNTTTPDTNIEVPNITECDSFNISVAALVDQYAPNDNDTARNNNGSYYFTVIKKLQHSVSIEVSSMPIPHCEKKLFVKDESDGSVLVDDEILNGGHKNITLEPFRKYRLLTEVKSLRNKVKDTKYTYISTYNVQSLTVSTEWNGSVSVQCRYQLGSTADKCHVIFTNSINGTVLNVSLSLVQEEPKLVFLPTGNYTVTAYDIVNGSHYGPAIHYEGIFIEEKYMHVPFTSSSIISENISPTVLSITLTILSATPEATPGTTPGKMTNDKSIVPVVAGTVTSIVPVVLFILAVCVGVTVYKRKKMKVQVLIRSEIATTQKSQAEINQYQEFRLLMTEVPDTTSSAELTDGPMYDENPYHFTVDEFLPDYSTIPSLNVEGLILHKPRPSLTSTATQETTLEDSISSTASNDIHDTEYTTDPTNVTDTITVTDTGNNEATAAMATVTDNTATTVAPTYAVVAKRTDTTAIPAVDQRVEYKTVTGDINKNGGGITVYPPNDISAIPPPPPSYAATIVQESGATVSSLQFKVPAQVTDDVDGKYGKYPTTNTENDYYISTPVQAETSTIDENKIIVQPNAASVPSNEDDVRKAFTADESPVTVNQFPPVCFQWLVSIEESLDFLQADDEYTADEMFGATKSDNFEEKEETGALVSGITLKAELNLLVKRKMKKFRSHNIFEDDENYEVVVAVPTVTYTLKPI